MDDFKRVVTTGFLRTLLELSDQDSFDSFEDFQDNMERIHELCEEVLNAG